MFYLDYIQGKPHQVYFLDDTRLLVFDYRRITENEAHIHYTLKTAKFTDVAVEELDRRRAIPPRHYNCRSSL